MRYLALLATYALVAALVLPGSIFAQGDPSTDTTTTPAEPAAPEGAPAAPAPDDGDRLEPGPESESQPAPPAPAPNEAAPQPQLLGDEASEAPASDPKALAAASGSVTIADFTFAPKTITVNQGDTVTWNNNGPTPHSATANDGSFDTGILKKGQTSSHTFSQAGTFSYFCTPHPFMKATVVVQAAQSGGDGTGGSGSSDAGDTGGSSGASGADASQSDDGGPALPDTGSDSGAMVVLGGLMLLLGIGIHRRTSSPRPRPAGRIGW
jgi:LPXTG-motif cell wall-anchored protein